MIQVMTHEKAKERGLYTIDPITGKQVPFTTWRVELSEEEKEELQKQIDEGSLPF